MSRKFAKRFGFFSWKWNSRNPKKKENLIQILKEKIKGMKDIELGSVSWMSYMGPSYDIRETQYNRKKQIALIPQTRRPKATSKEYKWLKEQGVINEDNK